MSASTPLARVALHHLNLLKPYDGWSIDTYETRAKDGRIKAQLILRRRNVALSDTGFDDILFDKGTGTVVGVISSSPLSVHSSIEKKKAAVLVERDGIVSRRRREINIEVAREAPHDNTHSSVHESSKKTSISSEQNKKILQYGGAILGSAVLLNIFSDVIQMFSLSLSFLLLPFIIIAALTCPNMTTFNAKKELKRVLRGQHLPEDHPEKPKGWLAETTARFTASVATELASGLGYEVEHRPLGCAIFTTVKLNSVDTECYWIGAFNKWYFIMQRKLNTSQ